MKTDYDIAVIGAGLLGCFTAKNLSKYNWKTAIFEKNADVCMEVSRANTAIIYPGYDPVPGTLKARLSVSASENFERLCSELGVRQSKTGSLMVSYGPWGDRIIGQKYRQGLENGVKGLSLISGAQTMALEPNIRHGVTGALYAPSTSTVNPWELGIAAAEVSAVSGTDIKLNAAVTSIQLIDGIYHISTGDQQCTARAIVNCGGLYSDKIIEMIETPCFKLNFSAADYLLLDDSVRGFVNHVIMHEPEEKGRGTTIVPTVNGNLMLGPSNVKLHSNTGFGTTEEGIRSVAERSRHLFPKMPLDMVIRSFASIRPSISLLDIGSDGSTHETGEHVRDLMIFESKTFRGFINLAGIKTPGLTCCDEIGRHVTEMLLDRLGSPGANPNFCSRRDMPPRFSDNSFEVQSGRASEDLAYGKIVCRCKKVTEGEIRDCIRRPVGATTVDGVKRRSGALMGRCQGGFCQQRIIEILADELGITASQVRKDSKSSIILGGR